MKPLTLIAALAAMALTACSGHKAQDGTTATKAVYYWRTTLKLDAAERQLLADQGVNRIYMRYFDVVDYLPVPNATIAFADSVPSGIEVVPVVYITQESVRPMGAEADDYADKLLQRVSAMSRSQGWALGEIQLDCDWTDDTREAFYALCQALRERCAERGIKVSSTIRLHQLTQEAPPVDSGVLMVYNTGAFKSISTDNSIFDPKDIMPYLADNRLRNYPLTLDVAWPLYGWTVAFDDNGQFRRLLHTTELDSIQGLHPVRPDLYKSDSYVMVDGSYIKGTFRVEQPSATDIVHIKDMIDRQLGSGHNNIIYHLDSKQLGKYTNNEIKDILHRD